jgi:hypothetical protein
MQPLVRLFAADEVIVAGSLLAEISRVEGGIALPGNSPLGGCQTSKNVALARKDPFAKLRCVSITHAHNVMRQCGTSCGNLSLFKALKHVVCGHWHAAALLLKFFAASYRNCSAFPVSSIVGVN